MFNRTIAQRQETYLKTVDLASLGEERDDAEAIEFSSLEQGIIELAVLFKLSAEDGLNKSQAIDTAKLGESIQFDAVKFMGGVYSVDISVLDYYDFVNKGVKGTVNKSGDSPYGFKNNYPSKAMVFAIRKWLIRHGLKSNSRAAKRGPLGTERKTQKFENSSNAMAYAISVSIKKKGLKATGFWDNAALTVEEQMEKTIGNQFAIDIVNLITK